MLNPRLRNHLLLLFSLFGAFGISAFLNYNVFLADSPQINRRFFADLVRLPQNIATSFNPAFRKENDLFKSKASLPPNLLLNSVAKGVKAAEDPATGKKYWIIEKGVKYEVREISYTDNEGKQRIFKIISLNQE